MKENKPKERKKVLIIEDEQALREALADEFGAAGFKVLQAADGEEGLVAIKQGPDLLIVDLLMPGMDGAEMLRQVEDEGWKPDTPVIILTNLGLGTRSVEQFVRDHPAWYLMKAEHSLAEVREKAEALLGLAEVSQMNKEPVVK